MRLTTRLVAASAGLLLAAPVLAAEPAVPSKFITGDTMMVARINLQHIKTQMIKDTINAVVDGGELTKAGIDNPVETPEFKEMIAGMSMAEGLVGSFIGMGATSVSIVIEAPEDEFGQPVMTVLIPSSSAESSDQIIQMMNMFGGMGAMAQKTTDGNQHWVTFAPMGEASGEGGNGAATTHFNTALSSMEGASVSWVMLPIEKMRDQMLENADDEEQAEMMAEMLENTNWMGMSINLGKEPVVKMVGDLKSADAAKGVNSKWKELMGTLVEKAKEAEDEQEDEEWPEGAPRPTEMAKFIANAASMETSGSRVNVVLDTKELRSLTTMFIKFADASGFSPMDMMPMGGF